MMQLARRTSLVVVLLLLASVGTAFAECAWVLWKFPTGKFYKPGRAGELPYEEVPFEFRNLLPSMERALPTYKDCMDQPEHRPLGDDKVRVVSLRGSSTGTLAAEVTFTCFPDTVDPRGPKAR